MITDLETAYQKYWLGLHALESQDFTFSELSQQEKKQKEMAVLKNIQSQLPEYLQTRLELEIHGFGALTIHLQDETITEILVNQYDTIWVEKNGRLHSVAEHFICHNSYLRIVERICEEAKAYIDLERPQIDGKFRDFRLCLVGPGITANNYYLSLRRHPQNPWSLEKLRHTGWCDANDLDHLKKIVHEHQNILVIGGTGSGKTSLLNALLIETSAHERSILIEDTMELNQPNAASIRLLTRTSVRDGLSEITQTELLKKSLRLRPDRLVMGEIRGDEAKDFLLLLSTGHRGSMGTLHANDPQQALGRLEMLVQMGAPQWSLTTIRRLIFLSLQYIVVTGRCSDGQRKLNGVYRLQALEEMGFLLEKLE